MRTEIYEGRSICKGEAVGKAVVTQEPLSFFGSLDPATGIVTEKGHELFGVNIAGKILVFPSGKGSTASTWALIRLKENGVAPAGIIVKSAGTIIITAVILARIPAVDSLKETQILRIRNEQEVRVRGDEGLVEVTL